MTSYKIGYTNLWNHMQKSIARQCSHTKSNEKLHGKLVCRTSDGREEQKTTKRQQTNNQDRHSAVPIFCKMIKYN